MKNALRHSIGLVGTAIIAAQLIGAPATTVVPFRGSSGSSRTGDAGRRRRRRKPKLLKQIS